MALKRSPKRRLERARKTVGKEREANQSYRVEAASVMLNISPRTIWRHLEKHKAPAEYRWTNLRGVKGHGGSHPTYRYRLRVLYGWQLAMNRIP